MPPVNFQNLIGKTFERLTVISRAPNGKNWKVRWNCECTCGNTTIAHAHSLRSGRTQSCGCLHREQITQRNITHNMTKSPEYSSWHHIIDRCCNPADKGYKNYGGRGITICDKWRKSFKAFYDYIGSRPSPKHSIDRINNDGNYEPGNIRWASKKVQANNSRHNHHITINGKTKNIAQWAKTVGLNRGTLLYRIKAGWPPVKALFTPTHKKAP